MFQLHELHHRYRDGRYNPIEENQNGPKISEESNGSEKSARNQDSVHFATITWLRPFCGKPFARNASCINFSFDLITKKHILSYLPAQFILDEEMIKFCLLLEKYLHLFYFETIQIINEIIC